jgi:TonB-linked SusC/RagA family outer membrane protein
LAISGGTGKFSHRTVLNVEQNEGILRNNDANKYLVKSNIHQNAFEGWLDLDYNLLLSKRKYNPSSKDAFRQAFFHNPTEPVYNPGDQRSGGYYTVTAMDYYNPVAMINETLEQDGETDNVGTSFRATLNILPIAGLKWDNFLSYNQERYEGRTYFSHYYPSLLGTDGSAEIENFYSNEIQWESTLSYSKQLDKHFLQAIGGYSYQNGVSKSSSLSNHGYDTDLFLSHNIGAGTALKEAMASMSSFKESHRYVAFFGRAMYRYDEKYMASVSLRRDGSSRFGDNNKWGWFPAVSAGWRIAQEEFMQSLTWLNELKLRAGFGITGNQDIPNYRSLLLFTTGNAFYNNGEWVNAYTPKTNPNPDLRWEKKSEWNVGLDFSVLGGRLSGTIDYYNRTTSDLLYEYEVPVPPYLVNTLLTNLGEINNQGIEITLTGTPVAYRNFKWNSSLTFSRNTNKLVKLTSKEFSKAQSETGWIPTPMGQYSQRIVEGESLGSFYAPVWLGVDANGKDQLKDAVDGSVPADQWEKIGTAYPDFVLGWGNMLTYKNWELSMMVRASIGGKVFNTYAGNYENITSIGLKNTLASWLDDTKFTGTPVYSSKYIEDATYLKVDNITLGHNFHFRSAFIQKMRLSLSAQNILCLTGYKGVDPEVSLMGLAPGIEGTSYYPRTAIYTFGINVIF